MTLKQPILAGTVVPAIKSEAERGGRAACHAQTGPVRVGTGMTFKKGLWLGPWSRSGNIRLSKETTLPVRGRPLTVVCVLRLAPIRRGMCWDHGPGVCNNFWAGRRGMFGCANRSAINGPLTSYSQCHSFYSGKRAGEPQTFSHLLYFTARSLNIGCLVVRTQGLRPVSDCILLNFILLMCVFFIRDGGSCLRSGRIPYATVQDSLFVCTGFWLSQCGAPGSGWGRGLRNFTLL